MDISVVDLFCGAGGLTRGFIDEGIPVVAGIDIDPACKYPYEQNNASTFILQDIVDVEGQSLVDLYPDGHRKILAGCAPCQPFSTYTQGRNGDGDQKLNLLDEFARLVEEVRPDIVTMENVTRLVKHEVFTKFVHRLEKRGMNVTFYDVYCPDYGVPQTRERLVLFASTKGQVNLVPGTHAPESYVTVKDKIHNLEPIGAGEACTNDPMHRSSQLSDLNLRRIRASKPGGTWRDWPDELKTACHSKEEGKHYSSVYGRMRWEEPSPTITTQFYGYGNGRFGHPEQDRAISLREAALLQTFPDDYMFVEPEAPVQMKKVGRLIGNAVPPLLGRAIARSIMSHVEKCHQ